VTGTALPQACPYGDAVDLDRYPINEPASPAYRPWSRRAGTSSASRGRPADRFLTPAAVSQMLALAGRLAGQAWASDQAHTSISSRPTIRKAPITPRAAAALGQEGHRLRPDPRRCAHPPPL